MCRLGTALSDLDKARVSSQGSLLVIATRAQVYPMQQQRHSRCSDAYWPVSFYGQDHPKAGWPYRPAVMRLRMAIMVRVACS